MGKKVEHPLDILREELQQTNVALKCAYDKFNYVTEPEGKYETKIVNKNQK